MRKLIFLTLLSAGLALTTGTVHAQSHNYVKVHPEFHNVARPAAPSPRHVWVAPEWKWRGGAYTEVPGYWSLPPAGHRAWVPGHWVATSGRGSYWIAGHWA